MIAVMLGLTLAASPLSIDDVRAGSRHQLDAIRAQLEVERAGIGKTQARSAILPQVSLNAGTSVYFGGPQRRFSTVPVEGANGQISFEQRAVDTPGFVQGNFQLGVTVSQLLYDGGRWWSQIALAGAQEEAAQGQLAEQQLASELEAVRRFYELVRAQQTLKVLEATLARSQQQLDRARSLFDAGRVQRRDVLDAEVNVGNDRIAALRQSQAITAAQADVLQWLGRPFAEVDAVAPVQLSQGLVASKLDVDDALHRARAKRPLFRSLQARIHAAELSTTIARADYYPSVGAQVAYQRQGPTADPFFTDPTKQNALSAGLSLSWNVFSGFATDSAVKRAQVDQSLVDAQEKQALADLEAEIRKGLKAVQTQEAVAEIAQANLGLARAELQVEADRYQAGSGSPLEVRSAELKLLSAELTVVQSRVDVEVARAALARSIGPEGESP